MICKYCGTQGADGSKFCWKCGKRIEGSDAQESAAALPSAEKVEVKGKEIKKAEPKKKKRKWKPIVAVITLAAILIMWIGGNSKDSSTQTSTTAKQNQSSSGTAKKSDEKNNKSVEKESSVKESSGENERSMQAEKSSGAEVTDVDSVPEQCSLCMQALNDYTELIRIIQEKEWTYFSDFSDAELDVMNSYVDAIHTEMKHECNSEVMWVEDQPYFYRNSLGVYTGEWKGGGPSGNGQFFGFWDQIWDVYDKPVFEFTTSYEGEWAYGLPEGEGVLYLENFVDSGWDMTYMGTMKDGLRDGKGYFYEYHSNVGINAGNYYHKCMMYDETAFQKDIIQGVTKCEQYDADTGKLEYYYEMIGAENGRAYMVKQKKAGEGFRKAVEFGATVITVALTAYLAKKLIDSSGNSGFDYEKADMEMFNELNAYRARQDAESLAREQADRKAKAQYYEDMYYESLKTDPQAKKYTTKMYEYNMNYFRR